ncbi:hypothetical protein FRB91_000293 [Serendipita sp. 411]|nr:hypothetical protein FRC18_012313 [Serendipita sp. 400]KAG8846998.1 hypothetical protein FRB91_000293 [Serendipita sp. 411]
MPLPVFGFDAETHLSKEEDLIYFVQSSDEDKGLEILWGRWLLEKESRFGEDPARSVSSFINSYWELIYHVVYHSGSKMTARHTVMTWLMVLKFHGHLSQSEVVRLSKQFWRQAAQLLNVEKLGPKK